MSKVLPLTKAEINELLAELTLENDMDFEQAFSKLIEHEGGFSNHPDDKGGATMWGITEKVARQNGYNAPMGMMTLDFAKIVYKKLYWEAIRAEELPSEVRFAVFDAAVNSGVTRAVRWLQQSVNEVQDGIIGPMTIKAVRQSIPSVTATRLNGIRLLFMTNQPNWSSFGKGWARRIASNLVNS
jgi:lysozyme family protein